MYDDCKWQARSDSSETVFRLQSFYTKEAMQPAEYRTAAVNEISQNKTMCNIAQCKGIYRK